MITELPEAQLMLIFLVLSKTFIHEQDLFSSKSIERKVVFDTTSWYKNSQVR